MTTLHKILRKHDQNKYATDNGTKTHAQLHKIVIAPDTETGDAALIKKIKQIPEHTFLFAPGTKTEVPIAGTVQGQFISRRIDRMYIDHTQKHIAILDYKTDIDRKNFYSKYISQMQDYVNLLHAIYPDYTLDTYLLWTHDFLLEKLPIKPL